jgi:hypothetical protein
LEKVAGKLINGALDSHVFLAAALDGTMPSPPLLPSAAQQAMLPRVAVGAGLRDREALSRGWQELGASAGEQAARWPEPVTSAETDGAESYEYPVPLGGPDLGVAVTIAANRWILGNARRLNETIAAPPPAAVRAPATESASGSHHRDRPVRTTGTGCTRPA